MAGDALEPVMRHFRRWHRRLLLAGWAAGVVEHGFELFEEVVDVVELAIDAGEADEGHCVQVAEIAHHELAELPALDFAFELGVDLVFDVGGGGLDLAAADGPLPAGAFQTAFDLLAIEGDARAVFLHDFDRGFFGRSYVVKRRPQPTHSRRRRTASPSWLERESMTLSLSTRQKGHFIIASLYTLEAARTGRRRTIPTIEIRRRVGLRLDNRRTMFKMLW